MPDESGAVPEGTKPLRWYRVTTRRVVEEVYYAQATSRTAATGAVRAGDARGAFDPRYVKTTISSVSAALPEDFGPPRLA
jgi:hypothetical protein